MRISFAGGGTEISPYKELYGGKVMNATISLFAHATIVNRDDDEISLVSIDQNSEFTFGLNKVGDVDIAVIPDANKLAYAITTYCIEYFRVKVSKGFSLYTYSEVPVGSGLGASSTLTVATLHALLHNLGITLDTYSLASTAFRIERDILGLSGGVQDHFCAAFGGFNFMEFGPQERTLVNPLRISASARLDLESSILLVDTGKSRKSSKLIDSQIKSMSSNNQNLVQLNNKIVENAEQMKAAILKGNLDEVSALLNVGWKLKKQISEDITNSEIESIFESIKKYGSLGSKLCGAGGGGFILSISTPENTSKIVAFLEKQGVAFRFVRFVDDGSQAWFSNLI